MQNYSIDYFVVYMLYMQNIILFVATYNSKYFYDECA